MPTRAGRGATPTISTRACGSPHCFATRASTHGDRVCISLPKGFPLYVTIHAALFLNACYVPIDYTTPVERGRRIIADAGAAVLVTTARNLEPAPRRHSGDRNDDGDAIVIAALGNERRRRGRRGRVDGVDRRRRARRRRASIPSIRRRRPTSSIPRARPARRRASSRASGAPPPSSRGPRTNSPSPPTTCPAGRLGDVRPLGLRPFRGDARRRLPRADPREHDDVAGHLLPGGGEGRARRWSIACRASSSARRRARRSAGPSSRRAGSATSSLPANRSTSRRSAA